ncbi:hypothetical protein GCM10010321_87100 [Streptomyces chartreusis]|nr:hypothetical protein GCM10010321_87100 [Streptomyces chartreusis]
MGSVAFGRWIPGVVLLAPGDCGAITGPFHGWRHAPAVSPKTMQVPARTLQGEQLQKLVAPPDSAGEATLDAPVQDER